VVLNAQAMAEVFLSRGTTSSPAAPTTTCSWSSFIEQGLHGQGRRRLARRREHHGQQERGAQRPAVAVRHQRHPRRHAGHHHPRLRAESEAKSWPAGCATSSTRRAGDEEPTIAKCKARVLDLCARFPVYGDRLAAGAAAAA
jgi:hypothetical protein